MIFSWSSINLFIFQQKWRCWQVYCKKSSHNKFVLEKKNFVLAAHFQFCEKSGKLLPGIFWLMLKLLFTRKLKFYKIQILEFYLNTHLSISETSTICATQKPSTAACFLNKIHLKELPLPCEHEIILIKFMNWSPSFPPNSQPTVKFAVN